VSSIVQDLRYAMRSVRVRPLLFVVGAGVLALGIGASTAVFSLLDAVLLRPLPFEEPDRLVLIWEHKPKQGQTFMEVSYADQADWKSPALKAHAVMATVNSMFIIGGDEPARVPGRLVSGNFFDVLGARPLRGRVIGPEDDRPGAALVMVVSYALWQGRFGADPAIVGRTLVVGDIPVTVVGVMPRTFAYPPQAELWMPVVPGAPEAVANRGLGWMVVLGRLAEGVTLKEARLKLDSMISTVWAARYAPEADRRAVVTPLIEHLFGPARTALVVFLGAVLLVLLSACGNVCALLLASSSARRREIAVRLALGAPRARLARQLLTESALIAGAGGLAGVLLAFGTLSVLVALVPADVPRLQEVAVDGRVLVFGVVVTALSALGAGLAPALMASKPSLTEALNENARLAGHPSHRRGRRVLIACEAAVAMVLLFGAGLLVQTFRNLQRVDLGFDPGHLLTFEVAGEGGRYAKQRDLYRTLLERIDGLPGVTASAAVLRRPLSGEVGWDWHFTAEGQTEEQAGLNPVVNLEEVTPRYFEAMHISVLRGRSLTERDDDHAPGAIAVSRAMAERCWPGQDAIGKRLKIPLPGTPYDEVWLTVVGVVADVRYRELRVARPDLYMSYLQSNHGLSHMVVRTIGDPVTMASTLRAAIRSFDRNLVVSDMQTMGAVVTQATSGARFAMQISSAFALAALLLAAIGTYGVMAFVIGRRTREVGIRMALGAQAANVMAMLVREGMVPVVVGLTVGLAGSLALGRALSGLLYGLPASDPSTLVTASGVLAAAALVACALPARRAARMDPASALREE
jgi:putative ABC transport system permease protein